MLGFVSKFYYNTWCNFLQLKLEDLGLKESAWILLNLMMLDLVLMQMALYLNQLNFDTLLNECRQNIVTINYFIFTAQTINKTMHHMIFNKEAMVSLEGSALNTFFDALTNFENIMLDISRISTTNSNMYNIKNANIYITNSLREFLVRPYVAYFKDINVGESFFNQIRDEMLAVPRSGNI